MFDFVQVNVMENIVFAINAWGWLNYKLAKLTIHSVPVLMGIALCMLIALAEVEYDWASRPIIASLISEAWLFLISKGVAVPGPVVYDKLLMAMYDNRLLLLLVQLYASAWIEISENKPKTPDDRVEEEEIQVL
jgi:hypothetical protein